MLRRRMLLEEPAPPLVNVGAWWNNLAQTELTKPASTNTINVSNWADFKTQATNLGPGDEIVFLNDIVATDSYIMSGSGGSAGSPAVVNMNGYKLSNGFGTYGNFTHSFAHSNVNHLWYWDAHWDGGTIQTWGPSFGSRFGSDTTLACTFITLAGCKIERTYQQGLKIGTASHDFVIDGLEVTAWACMPFNDGGPPGEAESQGATAVYLGEGSGANAVAWSVYNFDIRSLWVHDIGFAGSGVDHTGMGLQVKHDGRNMTIREFLFENFDTRSQGALNLNYDTTTSVNANHLAEDFVIRNIGRIGDQANGNGFGGQGVTLGGQTTMNRGLLYDLDSWGIEMVKTFPDAHKQVNLDRLTVYNTALHPTATGTRGIMQPGEYNTPGTVDPVVTVTNSIAPSGGQHVAAAADFVGPLTDIDGYVLAASSAIPATAGALGKAGEPSATLESLMGTVPDDFPVVPSYAVTNVATDAELSAALSGSNKTIRFTADINSPAHRAVQNLTNVVIDGNGHTLTMSGGRTFGAAFHFWNCTNVFVTDLTIDCNGNSTYGITTGRKSPANTSDDGPVSDFHMYRVNIASSVQEGTKHSRTTNLWIAGCDISDMGRNPETTAARNFCEGIYLGDGTGGDFTYRCTNARVERNYVHDTALVQSGTTPAGEAIDIKRPCENIQVRHNICRRINVFSQACITSSVNASPAAADVQIVIEDNFVDGVTKSPDGFQGDGIVVSKGDTICRRNTVVNTAGTGIRVNQVATGTVDTVTVTDNLCWNNGADSYRYNSDLDGGSTAENHVITNSGNRGDSGGQDITISSADLVNPSTTPGNPSTDYGLAP